MAKQAGSALDTTNGYYDDFSGASFTGATLIGAGEGEGAGESTPKRRRQVREKSTVQTIRATGKGKKLETQLALILQMTSYGAAFLLKNKHIEMEQSVNARGERNPTEALTIAKPLAVMLLESPWADTIVKLAETSASGSALVMAIVAYVARITMATMMEQMNKEGIPAEMADMVSQMMAGLSPVGAAA